MKEDEKKIPSWQFAIEIIVIALAALAVGLFYIRF